MSWPGWVCFSGRASSYPLLISTSLSSRLALLFATDIMSPVSHPHATQDLGDERVVVEASPNHHGIALWPPPSNDPHDPLRWPRWLKILALLSTALCNFTSNFAGAGPSVAVPLFEMEFRKTPSQVNSLLTVSVVGRLVDSISLPSLMLV